MDEQSRDIGRFTNAHLIGRGGFGSVYRAADTEHGRDVAIKVLHGPLTERERRRFDRERQTMGRLGSHPNIIPIHESGYTPEGEGFLVMDLATGGSLRGRLDRGERLDWRQAVDISVAMANAAQAAHDRGVLHRDIKPDNILIDAYGNYRLTDFGIAAVASSATTTTSTTATIAHAAPEVLEGEPSTAAVDIYAIASTFYALVTGLAPFQRPTDEGVQPLIARALTKPPPDLAPYEVPRPVIEVVERALAKRPDQRQPTAARLAEELAGARAAVDVGGAGSAGEPAPAGGDDDPTRAAPFPFPIPSDRGRGSRPVEPSAALSSDQDPTSALPVAGSVGVGGNQGPPPGSWSGGVHASGPPFAAGGPEVPGGYGPGSGVGGPVPPPSGGSRRWVGAAVALLAVALLAGGGGLLLSADGEGAAGEDSGVEPVDGSSTTPTITGAEQVDEPTSTTEAEVTTTSAEPVATTTTIGTPATTSTTAPEAISTTTTDPTDGPIDCDSSLVVAQNDSFDVVICRDPGSGQLTYSSRRRDGGGGLDLPACFAGEGVFQATNEGFLYVVNVEAENLTVLRPDESELIDQTLPVLELQPLGPLDLPPC